MDNATDPDKRMNQLKNVVSIFFNLADWNKPNIPKKYDHARVHAGSVILHFLSICFDHFLWILIGMHRSMIGIRIALFLCRIKFNWLRLNSIQILVMNFWWNLLSCKELSCNVNPTCWINIACEVGDSHLCCCQLIRSQDRPVPDLLWGACLFLLPARSKTTEPSVLFSGLLSALITAWSRNQETAEFF